MSEWPDAQSGTNATEGLTSSVKWGAAVSTRPSQKGTVAGAEGEASFQGLGASGICQVMGRRRPGLPLG